MERRITSGPNFECLEDWSLLEAPVRVVNGLQRDRGDVTHRGDVDRADVEHAAELVDCH